jgi:hypothetical protein
MSTFLAGPLKTIAPSALAGFRPAAATAIALRLKNWRRVIGN